MLGPQPGPVDTARPRREAGDRSQAQLGARPRQGRSEPVDDALLRVVYEEHGRAVFAYAARLLEEKRDDRGAAADITQETFERAWLNPQILTQGPNHVRAWLLTVARNLLVDRRRRAAARPQQVCDAALVYGSAGAAPDHADRVATAVAVHDALAGLSHDHREVLHHVYFKQHSVAEAAAAIGITPGTVKSRTHYALAALRAAFGARGERP